MGLSSSSSSPHLSYKMISTPSIKISQNPSSATSRSLKPRRALFSISINGVKEVFFGKSKHVYPQPEEPVMSENDNNVFEFDESDIYSLGDQQKPSSSEAKRSISIPRLRRKPAKVADSSGFDNRKTAKKGSLPVDIPDRPKILKSEYRSHVIPEDDSDEDEEINGGGTAATGGRRIIPPHEYLARRRESSSTVHEGFGGTTKGERSKAIEERDLGEDWVSGLIKTNYMINNKTLVGNNIDYVKTIIT